MFGHCLVDWCRVRLPYSYHSPTLPRQGGVPWGVLPVYFDYKKLSTTWCVGLQAMGRTAGAAFTAEHLVTDAQGPTFLLMGIEFYKIREGYAAADKGGYAGDGLDGDKKE